MKRLLITALWVGCFVLVTVAAQGQAPKTADTNEGLHQLLMLDQREGVEHAKTLHYYVERHKSSLDQAILMKHVDELGRNLEGMHAELVRIKETAAEDASLSQQLMTIQSDQAKAGTVFEQLKLEVEKPSPDASRLLYQSAEMYSDLKAASAQHNKVMSKIGIRESAEPVR